jgi:hypothetical protein
MGFWSSVGSICSSVASTISSRASSAWNGAKSLAGEAVSWMADKAEGFVGGVKEVWAKVKPYCIAISPYLKKAAALSPWPWLAAAITIFDSAIQGLLALENSPILKEVENAINWTISVAKKLKATYLTPKEIDEANERAEVFDEAIRQTEGEAKQSLTLASMVNDYIRIQSIIKIVFEEDKVKDFDHYLRLRATQKLLDNVERVFSNAESIDDISADEIFMLDVGAKLLKADPVLTDSDAIRLDDIIFSRFNKKLIPFVFEEMILSWQINLEDKQNEWSVLSNTVNREMVLLKRLEMAKRLSEISSEEEVILVELQKSVAASTEMRDALEKRNREMKNYVHAAEGFLQVLEKTEEELESEGRGFLAEDSPRVGKIIIDCAQNGKLWEELAEEDQMLIIDFANIFEEDCKNRKARMLEVEVGV